MHVDQLIENLKQSSIVEIPLNWGQGRTVYGGLITALMVSHAQLLLNDENKTLKSASITFVGPVTSGEKAELVSRILRSSKSVTTIQVEVIQNTEVVSIIIASFALPRESSIAIAHSASEAQLSFPKDYTLLPYMEGIMPEFLNHFDVILVEGDIPFSNSKKTGFTGWMKLKSSEEIAEIKLPHLFLLMDMWPASVLPMFNRPAPASSLTWDFDLIDAESTYNGDSWWKYEVNADYAANGYVYEKAQLWDETGKLVAVSRQTVAIYL